MTATQARWGASRQTAPIDPGQTVETATITVSTEDDPVDVGPDLGGGSDPSPVEPDCKSLLQKMNRILFGDSTQLTPSKRLITRFYQQWYGGKPPTLPDGSVNPEWTTHNDQIQGLQALLKKKMKDFIDDKCPRPPNWKVLDEWANKPLPSESDYRGPLLLRLLRWIADHGIISVI